MSATVQQVRLVDIFVLGPFMVWAASRPKLPPWAKLALGISGALTMWYNWQHYEAERGERP